MNIVHIVPGSGGGFYCQNCVRDMGLVKALQAAGHDVLFVPMYLPSMELADSAVAQSPVFFGAVNTWLQQKLPFYRRLPRAWRRLLDTPSVLRWAAARAGSHRRRVSAISRSACSMGGRGVTVTLSIR